MTRDYETFKRDEMKSEVYNALADIMCKYNATKKDMDFAIEWFNNFFYDDEYEED